MVKTVKEYDGRWTVYNTYSGETATIISFKIGRASCRERV